MLVYKWLKEISYFKHTFDLFRREKKCYIKPVIQVSYTSISSINKNKEVYQSAFSLLKLHFLSANTIFQLKSHFIVWMRQTLGSRLEINFLLLRGFVATNVYIGFNRSTVCCDLCVFSTLLQDLPLGFLGKSKIFCQAGHQILHCLPGITVAPFLWIIKLLPQF